MKKLTVLFLFAAILFPSVARVLAQDQPGCDTDSIAQALADATAKLATVHKDLEQDNGSLALLDLEGAEGILEDISARCFGEILTAEATEVSDAEWVQVDGDYVSLTAPARWINMADSSAFVDMSLDAFTEMNPQAGSFVELYRAQLDSGIIDILLVDIDHFSSLVVGDQNIGFSIELGSLETMLENQMESLGYTVKSTEIVEIPVGEALKVELSMDFGQLGTGISLNMGQIMYVFISDEVLHTVVFSTQSQYMDEMTPTFDQIIASVELR